MSGSKVEANLANETFRDEAVGKAWLRPTLSVTAARAAENGVLPFNDAGDFPDS